MDDRYCEQTVCVSLGLLDVRLIGDDATEDEGEEVGEEVGEEEEGTIFAIDGGIPGPIRASAFSVLVVSGKRVAPGTVAPGRTMG